MSDLSITTANLVGLLQARHLKEDGWATFVELCVRQQGGRSDRFIDLFAIQTWQSRFTTIAYEVKVTRNDFSHELLNPQKRVGAERVAHQCWFAVAPGVAKPEEVPEGWGLIQATKSGTKLRVLKHAKQKEPEPWPWSFIMMLARRCADAPPTIAPVLWNFEGQEITTEKLMEVFKDERDKAVAEAEKLAGRVDMARFRKHKKFVHAIWALTGAHSIEDFKRWMKCKLRERPLRQTLEHLERQLENALTELQHFMGEEGKESDDWADEYAKERLEKLTDSRAEASDGA